MDKGYAKILQVLIGIEHRDWLGCENIGYIWFCNEEPYTTKEQRVCITQWAARAWEKLSRMTSWGEVVGRTQDV